MPGFENLRKTEFSNYAEIGLSWVRLKIVPVRLNFSDRGPSVEWKNPEGGSWGRFWKNFSWRSHEGGEPRVHQVARKVPVFQRKVAEACADFTFPRSATRLLPSTKASPPDVMAMYLKEHPTKCQRTVSVTSAVSAPEFKISSLHFVWIWNWSISILTQQWNYDPKRQKSVIICIT